MHGLLEGFRVQGSGFRVLGSGFRVQGSGFGVQGSGFGVQGSGFRVQGGETHPSLPSQEGMEETQPSLPPAGCMAGKGFLFISHTGILQPCGFLPVECGNIRHTGFDVRAAYEASTVLKDLADIAALRGSCGSCAFQSCCGGCRARAFAASGDYLDGDPSCACVQGGHV